MEVKVRVLRKLFKEQFEKSINILGSSARVRFAIFSVRIPDIGWLNLRTHNIHQIRLSRIVPRLAYYTHLVKENDACIVIPRMLVMYSTITIFVDHTRATLCTTLSVSPTTSIMHCNRNIPNFSKQSFQRCAAWTTV